jgi:(1->4)-alpha-D-glucan 1-alpha-D-glucosylmutase
MDPGALTSSYRVQLNASFRLADARAVVPYLERLGISHMYTSPLLKARPGRQHG